MVVVGINGFGRIGVQTLRATLQDPAVSVAAINDPFMSCEQIAHALKYDSNYGRFGGTIETQGNAIVVDNHVIATYGLADPATIPWAEHHVEVVVEASGVYTTTERASSHLAGGAAKVIITAPSADAPTVVFGANEDSIKSSMQVISAGSCTAAAIAPALKLLMENYGVEECSFTCVHASTSGQRIVDGASSSDWRSGRAALSNIIPCPTGAVKTLGKVLPGLQDRVLGTSLRVPIQIGCAVDVTVKLANPASKATIDAIFQTVNDDANSRYSKVLAATEDQVVSGDVLGSPVALVDTRASSSMNDRTHKLLVWYDNEFGYATRVVQLVKLAAEAV